MHQVFRERELKKLNGVCSATGEDKALSTSSNHPQHLNNAHVLRSKEPVVAVIGSRIPSSQKLDENYLLRRRYAQHILSLLRQAFIARFRSEE